MDRPRENEQENLQRSRFTDLGRWQTVIGRMGEI